MITDKNKHFLARFGTLEQLHQLKNHPSLSVRIKVAENPTTPNEILRHLLTNDDFQSVKLAAIRNKNTSEETLHHMKDDADPFVKYAITLNPNTSINTLHHLKNEGSSHLIKSSARDALKTRFGIEE